MRLPGRQAYPKTIIIKGKEWKIEFVKKIGKVASDVGECDASVKVIRIKIGQSKKETFLTFIHELLHAIEDAYRFDLKHKHVYLLERAIGDVLLKNF